MSKQNQTEFEFNHDKREEDDVSDDESEPTQTEHGSMDFDTAMTELKALANDLESGELSLEEAMQKYQEGLELIEFCEERLEEAEMLIEEIDDSDPNSPTLEEKEPPENE